MTRETTIRLNRPLMAVRLEAAHDSAHVAPSAGIAPPGESAVADAIRQELAELARQNLEREAIAQVLAGITEAANDFDSRRRQLLAEMQQVAVELAVAVAGRLLHDKIDAGEFPIENVVRQAVMQLDAKQSVQVKLHPDDLELLAQRLGGSALATGAADVQWLADPTLARGDCQADAGEVSVLAQLDVQLADLRRHLLGSLDHAEIERRKTQGGDRSLRRFPDRRQTA